ncbi:MAG: MBL fold metallo-hydrolase, partial [Candidatus Heimdallarchaeaceae archaeon]
HGHLDHFGSLNKIKEKINARVLVHKNDLPLLKGTVKPEIVITDEYSLEEYGIKGKIIHTPGHSKGSITIVEDSKIAFIGDIAMKIPLLSPSYKPIIADDMEENFASWQKLIDSGVEVLYPSHGKVFNIGGLIKFLNKRKKRKKKKK